MGFNEMPPMPQVPERRPGERPTVPEDEIQHVAVRSSGPGGQNVNKTNTKDQLRWHIGSSRGFTEEEKALIRANKRKPPNNADEIVLAAQAERSLSQNREEVTRRLQDLVAEALKPKKVRRPTGVSQTQKQERLADKRHTGEKKQNRQFGRGDW